MKQLCADFDATNNLPTAAAMVAWVGVQLAALAVCSMRVPLWARSPVATEQLALIVMLATQTAMASVLFPILLRNVLWALIAIAVAWPMGELASFLADSSASRFVIGEIYVSIWLATLHLWTMALRSSWEKIFGAAIAAMVTLGGPLLFYLRIEFGETSGSGPPLGAFGPTAGVVSLMIPGERNTITWGVLALSFALAVIARLAGKKFSWSSRQVVH